MRLLYINRTNWLSTAANAVQQMNTAFAIAQSGTHVDYVVPTEVAATQREVLRRYGLPDCDNITIYPFRVLKTRNVSRFFQIRAAAALLVTRWKYPEAVLLTREPALILLARQMGYSTIYEAHDLHDLPFRFNNSERARVMHRKAIQRANGVITVTRSGAGEMQRVCGVSAEHICVAPDAAWPVVFPAARSDLASNADVRITYVGSLWPDKGVDVLVDALPLLPPRVHLTMVGGPENQIQLLRTRATELGKQQKVEFVGQRTPSEVHQWLANSDILVLPMNKGKWSDLYASPIKLFEYMASARPMVVADVPTLREIVDEQYVTFFAPGNPASLTQAMTWVIEHWDLALVKAHRAQELLNQSYTYNCRAAKILEFIRSKGLDAKSRQ